MHQNGARMTVICDGKNQQKSVRLFLLRCHASMTTFDIMLNMISWMLCRVVSIWLARIVLNCTPMTESRPTSAMMRCSR